MESTASLQQSYELIGRILAKLLLGGLSRQNLNIDSVVPDSKSVADRKHFWDVMSWLIEEGLITSQHQSLNGDFTGVQLTSKGIASVESKSFSTTRNGSSIRDAIEAKPEGSLPPDTYGKIGSFIGGFAGGFVQALS